MVPEVDKAKEGLRELAGMIATDYIRRVTGKTEDGVAGMSAMSKGLVFKSKRVTSIKPGELWLENEYTEVIKTQNLLRNSKQKK